MFSDIARMRGAVLGLLANKKRIHGEMDEGQKRVLALVAGILVARHLKTPEYLRDSRPGPKAESLIASSVQWGPIES